MSRVSDVGAQHQIRQVGPDCGVIGHQTRGVLQILQRLGNFVVL